MEQEIIFVGKESKGPLLEALLAEYRGAVLVFSRTKHGARKICRALQQGGHRAAEIHSNKSLNLANRTQRQFAKFKLTERTHWLE